MTQQPTIYPAVLITIPSTLHNATTEDSRRQISSLINNSLFNGLGTPIRVGVARTLDEYRL